MGDSGVLTFNNFLKAIEYVVRVKSIHATFQKLSTILQQHHIQSTRPPYICIMSSFSLDSLDRSMPLDTEIMTVPIGREGAALLFLS